MRICGKTGNKNSVMGDLELDDMKLSFDVGVENFDLDDFTLNGQAQDTLNNFDEHYRNSADLEPDLGELQKSLDIANVERDELKGRLAATEKKLANHVDQVAELTKQLEQARRDVDAARAVSDTAEMEISGHRAEADGMRDLLLEYESKYGELRPEKIVHATHNPIRAANEAVKAERDQLRTEVARLTAALHQKKAEGGAVTDAEVKKENMMIRLALKKRTDELNTMARALITENVIKRDTIEDLFGFTVDFNLDLEHHVCKRVDEADGKQGRVIQVTLTNTDLSFFFLWQYNGGNIQLAYLGYQDGPAIADFTSEMAPSHRIPQEAITMLGASGDYPFFLGSVYREAFGDKTFCIN